MKYNTLEMCRKQKLSEQKKSHIIVNVFKVCLVIIVIGFLFQLLT